MVEKSPDSTTALTWVQETDPRKQEEKRKEKEERQMSDKQ